MVESWFDDHLDESWLIYVDVIDFVIMVDEWFVVMKLLIDFIVI